MNDAYVYLERLLCLNWGRVIECIASYEKWVSRDVYASVRGQND